MAAYVPWHHFIYDEWARPLPFFVTLWVILCIFLFFIIF